VIANNPLSPALTMKPLIFDRYILVSFVKTLLICLISFAGIFIVFDLSTRSGSFFKGELTRAEALLRMGKYYFLQLLPLVDQLTGIFLVFASVITISQIAKKNELTALYASGIAPIRTLRFVFVAAAVVVALATVNRECIIPMFAEEIAYATPDPTVIVNKKMDPKFDKNTGVFFLGDRAFGKEKKITNMRLRVPLDARSNVELAAAEGFYQPASANLPEGYLLKGVHSPASASQLATLRNEKGEPVLYTSKEYPKLLAPDECFIATQLNFDLLTEGKTELYSSTATKINGLRNISVNATKKRQVAVHSRLLQPAFDLCLVFIALPLVITYSQRNAFLAAGVCLAASGLFFVTVLGVQEVCVGTNLSPSLALWLPLAVFVPVAANLLKKLK